MSYRIEAPELAGHLVELRHSVFSEKIFLDGQPVARESGVYRIMTASGTVSLILKQRFPDPIPNVEVNGRLVVLTPTLPLYVWLWAGLPMILIFVGGAIGGACGGFATIINARLFRSGRSGVVKVFLSGLCSLAAFVAYLVIASLLYLAIDH